MAPTHGFCYIRTLHSVTVDRPPLKDIAGVRYIGASDVRIVDGFAMAAVGVTPAEHDLVWYGHDSVAPIDRLNAGIVDYLLANHGDEFELVLKDDGAA